MFIMNDLNKIRIIMHLSVDFSSVNIKMQTFS